VGVEAIACTAMRAARSGPEAVEAGGDGQDGDGPRAEVVGDVQPAAVASCSDMNAGNRPLLFLDVNGPLIPFGGHHEAVDHHLDHRLTPTLTKALASNPQM
jgi:hypothetical protein